MTSKSASPAVLAVLMPKIDRIHAWAAQGVIAGLAVIASAAGACAQPTEQLSLPNVTVTAPAPPVAAPYLRDPGKAYQRNPYSGRYRVEEERFREVPCTATFIAPAT